MLQHKRKIMKLKTCLEIGNTCGLKMFGECVNNITIHSNIFGNKIIEEIEIYNYDTPINVIVDANNWEWYYKTKEDKLYGVYSLREKKLIRKCKYCGKLYLKFDHIPLIQPCSHCGKENE